MNVWDAAGHAHLLQGSSPASGCESDEPYNVVKDARGMHGVTVVCDSI